MRYILFVVLGFMLGVSITNVFSKSEQGSGEASSVVGYGKSGTTLVAIKVDANGNLQ